MMIIINFDEPKNKEMGLQLLYFGLEQGIWEMEDAPILLPSKEGRERERKSFWGLGGIIDRISGN